MSQELTIHMGAPIELTADRMALLRRTLAKGCDEDEFQLYIGICRRTNLDPLSYPRLIYPIKRYDAKERREVMGIQVSIDGFRLIAERSGAYQGQIGPEWCGPDGAFYPVWLGDGPPFAARVGVRRKDWPEPLWAVARFDSYKQTYRDGNVIKLFPLWEKSPDLMLAKCAEALAMRKAFPALLSGLGTDVGAAIDLDAEEADEVAAGRAAYDAGETLTGHPSAALKAGWVDGLNETVEASLEHERATGTAPFVFGGSREAATNAAAHAAPAGLTPSAASPPTAATTVADEVAARAAERVIPGEKDNDPGAADEPTMTAAEFRATLDGKTADLFPPATTTATSAATSPPVPATGAQAATSGGAAAPADPDNVRKYVEAMKEADALHVDIGGGDYDINEVTVTKGELKEKALRLRAAIDAAYAAEHAAAGAP